MKLTKQARRHNPETELREIFETTRILKGNGTLKAMQALWRARDTIRRAPLDNEALHKADLALRDLQMKLLAAGIGDDLATATA